MPQLGETVTEGTITKWLKKVGDSVAVDETLFEVSTDKVDSEVPSPSAGVLTEIVVNEGDTADVGAKLAVISDAGSAPAPAPAEAPAATAPAAPTPAEAPAVAPPAVSAPAERSEPEVSSLPANAVALAAEAPQAAPSDNKTSGKLLSPIVRKLINDNKLDASTIVGTGVGGRITRADVEAVLASPSAAPAPAPVASAPAAPSAPAPAVSVAKPSSGDTVVPFDNMRRRTAEHMVMSKATSPHAYISVEVDFENVERIRAKHGKEFKEREGFSLTYLPFIVRALSEVLPEFPYVNASVDGDNLVVHHDFHCGIAVDLDFKGLLVPSVRNADGKRLRLIAQEIRDLAVRARSKQLRPDEIIGSTFTITNPGPMGTYQTYPIINQPQVAILATDGISKKPVVVQDSLGTDVIAIHHVGTITLGWDHRAFDGSYTAAFLKRVKEVLETRDWEAEIG
jgi:pyruvate dehydrogenase E2 component (dihydrolipoamide acetyltransferase)